MWGTCNSFLIQQMEVKLNGIVRGDYGTVRGDDEIVRGIMKLERASIS